MSRHRGHGTKATRGVGCLLPGGTWSTLTDTVSAGTMVPLFSGYPGSFFPTPSGRCGRPSLGHSQVTARPREAIGIQGRSCKGTCIFLRGKHGSRHGHAPAAPTLDVAHRGLEHRAALQGDPGHSAAERSHTPSHTPSGSTVCAVPRTHRDRGSSRSLVMVGGARLQQECALEGVKTF